MKYRLKNLTPTLYRVHLGRDAIGWVRKGDDGLWNADAKGKKATGATASEAFHELVRVRNNDYARREGFDNAAQMIAVRNEEVRKHVEEVNALAGMPILRIRRRRIRV